MTLLSVNTTVKPKDKTASISNNTQPSKKDDELRKEWSTVVMSFEATTQHMKKVFLKASKIEFDDISNNEALNEIKRLVENEIESMKHDISKMAVKVISTRMRAMVEHLGIKILGHEKQSPLNALSSTIKDFEVNYDKL